MKIMQKKQMEENCDVWAIWTEYAYKSWATYGWVRIVKNMFKNSTCCNEKRGKNGNTIR